MVDHNDVNIIDDGLEDEEEDGEGRPLNR
jgi:hypothetical protein